ncbi:MAG: hypothetical protein ACJ8CN_07850, partial [Gemmatimonadales bacterium]
MRCRWRELFMAGGALAWGYPVRAQVIRELGIQTIGTFSDPGLLVAGGFAALRTTGRTRLSLGLGAGVSDGELAVRGELLGHFLLSPEEHRKPGFYMAGGIAGIGGPVGRGYLVLTLGLEQAPGRDSGWAVEIGAGGGVRVAAGYRWRRLPGYPGNKNA